MLQNECTLAAQVKTEQLADGAHGIARLEFSLCTIDAAFSVTYSFVCVNV